MKKDQRIDYPAKEISNEVERRWKNNFNNEIGIVVGQAWWAGNLSYHLESRPKYIRVNLVKKELKPQDGVVYIGNESILKKPCNGALFSTHSVYICMVGIK